MLVHDRSDPFGFDDCPDEKRYAADGHEYCFDREQMADLVHREPDGGKATKPKKEETQEVFGVCVGTRWEGIGQVLILGPNRADHECHTLPSNPRLNPVPNACHGRSIEDRP